MGLENNHFLVGGRTIFALLAGVGCAWFGILKKDRAKSLILSLLMGGLMLFIGFLVKPVSMGYSGPLSPLERELPRYDIHFAEQG